MIPAATVVWILQTSPTEAQAKALDEWAKAHDVALAPASDAPAAAVAIDWAAGDRVEEEIAAAREALVGVDVDAAERHLARAEATLRDHPELPQAAWLRAEVERTWSARWLRTGDEAPAKRAWQRAAALDGGRAPGLGEKAFDAEPAIGARVEVIGDGALRLDGEAIAAGDVKRGPGEHAIAIVDARGRVIWASWISLAQGTRVRVEAPPSAACSRDDVGRARVAAGSIDARGVRCGRWIAATSSDRDGAIRVAACERDACAPWSDWSPARALPPPIAPAEEPKEKGRWPTWATWVVAGAAVAGAAVTIVAVTQASKSPPTETRFVNGGIQVHGFAF